MRINQYSLVLLLLMASAAPAVYAADCSDQFQGGKEPTIKATKAPAKLDDLCFTEYDVLFSGETYTPIWSAEHLTKKRMTAASKIPRVDSFHVETRLPEDEQISTKGYGAPKYDRGHMSPSADFSTPETQKECFSMANMVPQTKQDNEHIWAWIENTVRGIALHDDDVYVVTGPVFSANPDKLHKKIEIPSQIFKAVYVPSVHGATVYISDNDDQNDWKEISVDDLTAMTGIDPFPGVSASVKSKVYTMPPPSAPGSGKKKKKKHS